MTAAAATTTYSYRATAVAPAGATGYKAERSAGGGAWAVLVANTGSAATTYRDLTAAPATSYQYRVTVLSATAASPPFNLAGATTPGSASIPRSGPDSWLARGGCLNHDPPSSHPFGHL